MPQTLTGREAMTVRARLGTPERNEDLSVWVRGVLAGIYAGSRVPPAVKHPLGFVCVQLYRGTGWGLCMHIWRSPEPPANLATSLIHSHSWDLSSQVICGRLENIEIRVMDEQLTPTHRVLEITSANGRDLVRPTRRLVSFAANASAYIEAGGNYRLPAGKFHVSRPSAAGPTMTILLAEDRYKSPELALGRLDTRRDTTRRRPRLASDLRSIAGITLCNLDARLQSVTARCDEAR